MKLALVYAILALIAIVANIGCQDLVARSYSGPYAIALAIAIGTAAGLIVKYILDKRYIFQFEAKNAAHDGRTFILYTVMGLATTAIFWGFELAFQHIFQSDGMRYLGGAIGLAIGYVTKYHLDKRFVFRVEAA